MRTVDLAKIAAKAEILRLQRQGRRTGFRIGYAVVAGTFMTAALAAVHVAIVLELMEHYPPITAVLIVAGGDFVIAIVVGLMASRDVPDAIEREALEVEHKALGQLGESMAMAALVGPALRLLGTRKAYGITLAALTARYLGGRR
jgi:threonine/homoserine/homoserine lactone efflux protein